MATLHLKNRIEGALLGLLIGDALGVPYEFHLPEDIPSLEGIEYVPPKNFERAHEDTPPGTWSDDGAQALCLLASLLYKGSLDLDDFAHRLINWYDLGYMAVDFQVFDVGVTTSKAILNLKAGYKADKAGIEDQYSNGNGSLMRVLPLVLWHKGSDEELIRDSQLQSCVTHRHLRSQVCCALYCLWARNILYETTNPWEKAVSALKSALREDDARREELDFSIRPLGPYTPKGSGYVVDCLHSAKASLEADSFEKVVKRAIKFGNDTDTTACVAGGVAGLVFGVEGIPQRWKNGLRGKEIYTPLLKELLQGIDE